MLLNIILSFIGWSILPKFITSTLLTTLTHLRLLPTSQSQSTRVVHYRMTFALVVFSYLLYTLITAFLSTPQNYYQQLGVTPSVDDAALRTAYRSWVRKNHPDKRGGAHGAEDAFRRVQEGFEVLKDPILRFAYDRFGPEVLAWKKCTTQRDYLRHGLLQATGYHVVTGAGLVGIGAVGRPSMVTFWRYLLYFALLAAELSLLLSPSLATTTGTVRMLGVLFPKRVVFQHVLFCHQIFVFLSIALSRIAPVLCGDDAVAGAGEFAIARQGPRDAVANTHAAAAAAAAADGQGFQTMGWVERLRRLVVGLEEDVNLMLTAEFTALTCAFPHSLSCAPICASPRSKAAGALIKNGMACDGNRTAVVNCTATAMAMVNGEGARNRLDGKDSKSQPRSKSVTIPPPFTSLPPLSPSTLPERGVLQRLTTEIEDMVVEGSIREEARAASGEMGAGKRPSGSVRGRAMLSVVRGVFGRLEVEGISTAERVRWWEGRSQREIEPACWPLEKEAGKKGEGRSGAKGLPSPRPTPSPPPIAVQFPGMTKGDGYVRARSVSC